MGSLSSAGGFRVAQPPPANPCSRSASRANQPLRERRSRLLLATVALPNLTQDRAAERAALVTVDSYRIDLDLTDGAGKPGEKTFRSVTTVEFDATPGADTYLDLAADAIRSATLNGQDIDVSAYDESTGVAARPGRPQRRRHRRGLSLYQHRRGPAPLVDPPTARSTCTHSSRPPTPSGCSPASTSPISRPPSTSPSPRRRTGR